MKRTTISLPDDLAALLAREAKRQSTSVSEIVRISLTAHLRAGNRRRIPWVALVDDAAATPASDLERVLEQSWADDVTRDR